LAGSFTPENELASACVLEIQCPPGEASWGEIKWLAADKQGEGHGMAAMKAALEYIRAHADDKEFRLWADNFSETYKSARLEL
jgi:RimJ/RimL family protein N-acetyltransferase